MIDNTFFTKGKLLFHTLGCKLNFAETSYIGRQLLDSGYVKAKRGEEADICIINTCSVTDIADNKSRQVIKRIKRQNPQAKIIVTGCYAQLKPKEVAELEAVDLVLGAKEKFNILNYLNKKQDEKILHSDILKNKTFDPSYSYNDRTRYFLKIQDGCDYYCSYCTIPLARGHSRSGSIKETMKNVEAIIQEGAKEIVLTGVNTGDFGKRNGETFLGLLQEMDKINTDVRYRISSIEPNLLTTEIIEFVAKSKHFMPHFHIPLQGGSDEILKIMRRKYDTSLFRNKIETIRNILPNAFIGVDTIVGVRGETDELFKKGYDFINSIDCSQLHVFTYSERKDTQMVAFEHIVPIQERKRRSELLHQLSEEKTKTFYNQQRGKTTKVLWENKKVNEKMYGFSENYIKVECDYNKQKINTLEDVTMKDWNNEKNALTIE